MKHVHELAVQKTVQSIDEFEKTVKDNTANQQAVPAEGGNRVDPVQQILEIARNEITLYHTPEGEAFATVAENNQVDHCLVQSRIFEERLIRLIYQQTGNLPGKSALNKAIDLLEAEAKYARPECPLHIRCACYKGDLYISLNKKKQARIRKNGWKIIPALKSPVKFRYPSGMQAMPDPDPNGTVLTLRQFVNIGSDNDFILIVAWIVSAFIPSGPQPILTILGEQGAAKSSLARVLRLLIDPSLVPSRALCGLDRDLIIAAHNSWIQSFDNLSSISSATSDFLCRLATGGGVRTRAFWTDREEKLFYFIRPIILNGISNFVTRHDLADRALTIKLPSISETNRRTDAEFWRDFEVGLPSILGGIFTALSMALRNFDNIKVDRLPRMADFAKRAIAAEPALPWVPGMFMAAFNENRNRMIEDAIESDTVACMVEELMKKRSKPWIGAPTKLKSDLDQLAIKFGIRGADWPKGANVLSTRLDRAQSFLKKKGICIERSKSGNRRINITKLEQPVQSCQPAAERVYKKDIANSFIGDEIAMDEAAIITKQFGLEDECPVEYQEV